MLTVAQVAERLCVEHKTVRALLKARKLRAVRLGRVLRIRESDYEDFIEKNLV